jgi:hypothetical protein
VDKGGLSEENTGNGALRRRRGLCRCDIESAAGILDFLSESAGPADVCRKSSVSAAFVWYQELQRMPGLVSSSAILAVPTAGQQHRCQAKFGAAQSFSLAIRNSVNDSTSENVIKD